MLFNSVQSNLLQAPTLGTKHSSLLTRGVRLREFEKYKTPLGIGGDGHAMF